MPWILVSDPHQTTKVKTRSPRRISHDEPHWIYQIRVDLDGIRPPIWRCFTIPGSVSLYQLHRAIQAVMDWTGGHLYAVEVDDESYGDPDPELNMRNAKTARLMDVVERGKEFTYVYDFGDDWRHKVRVEETHLLQPEEIVPQCLRGKRACPPEDVGGVWGYEEFLTAMADPNHLEHDEMVEWIGGNWDSEAFDRDACEERLRSVARIGRWLRTGR